MKKSRKRVKISLENRKEFRKIYMIIGTLAKIFICLIFAIDADLNFIFIGIIPFIFMVIGDLPIIFNERFKFMPFGFILIFPTISIALIQRIYNKHFQDLQSNLILLAVSLGFFTIISFIGAVMMKDKANDPEESDVDFSSVIEIYFILLLFYIVIVLLNYGRPSRSLMGTYGAILFFILGLILAIVMAYDMEVNRLAAEEGNELKQDKENKIKK